MDKNNLFALTSKVGALCREKGVQLAFAESCTGGLLAKTATDLSGSSAWFLGSVVAYSDHAKEKVLGVPKALLLEYGAVSEETAAKMAVGALPIFSADIALSITGVAGPLGGTPDKPVGMVCFGLAQKNGDVMTTTQFFTSGRAHVRYQAVEFVLSWLIDTICSSSS